MCQAGPRPISSLESAAYGEIARCGGSRPASRSRDPSRACAGSRWAACREPAGALRASSTRRMRGHRTARTRWQGVGPACALAFEGSRDALTVPFPGRRKIGTDPLPRRNVARPLSGHDEDLFLVSGPDGDPAPPASGGRELHRPLRDVRELSRGRARSARAFAPAPRLLRPLGSHDARSLGSRAARDALSARSARHRICSQPESCSVSSSRRAEPAAPTRRGS
jgi:hypothetical protein